jgi:hypothetical protein
MPIEMLPADVRALLTERLAAVGESAGGAQATLLAMADGPVPWAEAAWPTLLAALGAKDNHQRAFAAQLLARLAISAPARALEDLPAIAALLRDPRTVTARLTVQSIWRIGLAGPKHARRAADALALRFHDCAGDKTADAIRLDIMISLGRLGAALTGEARAELDATAARLIDSEADPGVQFKQRAALRKGQKLPSTP